MSLAKHIEDMCDSPLWDNQISWNTTSPQLSSCFTETLLVWIPSAFLWIFVPYLLFDIIRSNKSTIEWNYYNILRLTLAIVCTCVALVECIWCLVREFSENLDSPTAAYLLATVIKFITKLLLCVIFYCHRVSGHHSSGIVWLYLLCESIFDAFSVATYATTNKRHNHEFILFLIQYSIVVLLFFICSFTDRMPAEYDDDLKVKICPKEKASFPSRLTFWWMNGLTIKGWRNPLTVSDLWAIRGGDKCKSLFQYFNSYWKNESFNDEPVVGDLANGSLTYKYKSIKNIEVQTQNTNKKKKTKLLVILFKAFWFYFTLPSIIKLISDLVQLVNPLILKLLINFTVATEEPEWHGYVYALLFVLTNVFQSMISAYHAQRMSVLGMRIRTCLVTAVYRKSLVLSNYAKKNSTTGEIVNLMAVDAQRFIDLLPWLSFLWTAPIQIAITLWLLWAELDVAVLGGLFMMIVFIPINGFVAGKVKAIQAQQMKLKDQRIKSINEILSGIKVLKLYAWEEAFIENILSIRAKELKFLRRSGLLMSIYVCFSTISPFLVSLVTFAIYVLMDASNVLTAQKAFVSIALFNLLRIPLTMVPNMITSLILTIVSLTRLDNFLNSSELSGYVTRNNISNKEVVTIENGAFSWDNPEENDNQEAKPILNKINLKVSKGNFVAIVGVVGSGKTSLLSAILGEMEKISGNINVNGDIKIAYVPQQAWIQNATLKDNIIFGSNLNDDKYKNVIRACALKQDLSVLAGGDETEIGEKGINLSGGQKQRVSLARACYSDADLYLLDDPLSAVDSHVGKHILDEVLSSKTGLLRDKTRLLVTNSLYILPEVDLIIVLKKGEISDIGTYNDLMSQNGDFADLINQYSTNKSEDNEIVAEEHKIRRQSSTIEKQTQQLDTKKLVEIEKAETGDIKFSVYKKYAQAMTLFWSSLIVICYASQNATNAGSSFWLAAWTSDTDESRRQSLYRLGIYALIGCSQGFFVAFAWISNIFGTILASSTLHEKLLSTIMHAPMMFFDTTPMGRILNRFSKDIDVLDTIIQMTIRVVFNTGFNLLATIFIISIQTPYFLVICVPVFILYYLIQVKACDLLKENTKMSQLFSSQQCISNDLNRSLRYELCFPTFNIIIKQIKETINDDNNDEIATVYIATDSDNETLWREMHTNLPNVTLITPSFTISQSAVVTHQFRPTIMIDIYLMTHANQFIGNCISSFSAFISRLRVYNLHHNNANKFFAQYLSDLNEKRDEL